LISVERRRHQPATARTRFASGGVVVDTAGDRWSTVGGHRDPTQVVRIDASAWSSPSAQIVRRITQAGELESSNESALVGGGSYVGLEAADVQKP